jgi:hypothetical protein
MNSTLGADKIEVKLTFNMPKDTSKVHGKTFEGTCLDKKSVIKHRANKISIIKKKYVEATAIKLDQTVFKHFIQKLSGPHPQKIPLRPVTTQEGIVPNLPKNISHKSFIESSRQLVIPCAKISLCEGKENVRPDEGTIPSSTKRLLAKKAVNFT